MGGQLTKVKTLDALRDKVQADVAAFMDDYFETETEDEHRVA